MVHGSGRAFWYLFLICFIYFQLLSSYSKLKDEAPDGTAAALALREEDLKDGCYGLAPQVKHVLWANVLYRDLCQFLGYLLDAIQYLGVTSSELFLVKKRIIYLEISAQSCKFM